MAASAVRAAIYLRISLDRKMDGLAVGRQRDVGRPLDWATTQEWLRK